MNPENQSKIETTNPKEPHWYLAFWFNSQKEILGFLDKNFPTFDQVFKKNRAKAIEKGENSFESYNPKTKDNNIFYINGPYFCSTNRQKIKNSITHNQKIQQAKKEVELYGITLEQRNLAYVKWKSEKAFNNIVPVSYPRGIDEAKKIYNRYVNNLGRDKIITQAIINNIKYQIPITKRDDAFCLYLWLPQKTKSFTISETHPNTSKEAIIYYKPNYLNSKDKQDLLDAFFYEWEFNRIIKEKKFTLVDSITIHRFKKHVFTDRLSKEIAIRDNPLWRFKLSQWKDWKGDYISLYDKWDLNPFKMETGVFMVKIGTWFLDREIKKYNKNRDSETEASTVLWAWHPFEIYDRIYFDPITKKIKE